ncbi:uncharacterized protein DUF4129 [Melghirimyces profundicolus]|uniref:Uncharacterized protein DUF4129 n=1 Tax=Melghirimyces profundicolus TaxID=1242148 RepID=A0A2T6BG75_9BACL|nr:DUF4129 domain-containing protein [Melghirimyces profundicolus]PTX55068.1 uncharacterized protein DUF4129 [Melghirimyces profundicolus]
MRRKRNIFGGKRHEASTREKEVGHGVSPDYREARKQLSEILKEENRSKQNWLLDIERQLDAWSQEANRWLSHWMETLFGMDVDVRIGWLLPFLLALMGGLTFFWLRRRVHFHRTVEQRLSGTSSFEKHPSSRWWDLAETYAERREYREGIRCLFRSVLVSLNERRVLVQGDFKTNREYRQEVERNRSELLPAFSALIQRFDRVWYGRVEAREEDYTEFKRLSAELVKGGGAG